MNIDTFYDLYKSSGLHKPRLQRKKRWDNDTSRKYIAFLVNHRNAIIPFLANEKLDNSTKKYYIFDGNNRSNAILEFLEQPLLYKKEFIPHNFPEKGNIYKTLLSTSLKILTHKCRYRAFCQEYNLMDEYNQSLDKVDDETAFDNIIEKLADMKFEQISLPFTIFSNLSDNEMCEIYESINTGGVKLTPQELLASSCSTIKIMSDKLYCFNEVLTIINNEYYSEMNKNEKLHVHTEESRSSINLFELLAGFQFYLSKKYEFIPKPFEKTTGHDEYDLVFKLYKEVFDGFSPEKVPTDINLYLQTIEKGCTSIKIHMNCFFSDYISYKDISKCRKLAMNSCIILLEYVFIAVRNNIDYKLIDDNIKRVLLYNKIINSFLPKERSSIPVNMKTKDSIRVAGSSVGEGSGGFIMKQMKNIRLHQKLEHIPTDQDIMDILYLGMKNNVHPRKFSEKLKHIPVLNQFKALALSAFCSTHVPSNFFNTPFNKDHIVPNSSKWDENEDIDIHRLGNFVLIPELINKARGTKPITKQWIDKNGLKYMEYPEEEIYTQLLSNKFVQKDTFNTMCEMREAIYVKAIMELLVSKKY